MRILLSSFAISPFRGSEAGVGWEIASRLARHHDVTVVFGDLDGKAEWRDELSSWFSAHPGQLRLTPVYVPPSPFSIFCERAHLVPGLRLLYYWAYHAWQKKAFAAAREMHRRAPFDLVHHVTFTGYWEPGYAWKLGIPFFWGPVSGASTIPMRYIPILGATGALEAIARKALSQLRPFTHPRIRAAARRAAHIWCVTPAEQKLLGRHAHASSLLLETGSADEEPLLRRLAVGEELRLVWSGLHIPRKALALLLRAARLLPEPGRVIIDILGATSGREQTLTRAQSLAAKIGVPVKIVWHGKLPRDRALEVMRKAHALVHTSILEGTSCVVMEALSQGLPVLCHDGCGMASAVTPDCGILIPMKGIRLSAQGFAAAILSLLDKPERIEQLSRGAAERARSLRWEQKIEAFLREYPHALPTPAHAPTQSVPLYELPVN